MMKTKWVLLSIAAGLMRLPGIVTLTTQDETN